MRLSDFRARMRHAFGDVYAESVARDQQLVELEGRSVEQALADGEDAVRVWRAVHAHFELPARDR